VVEAVLVVSDESDVSSWDSPMDDNVKIPMIEKQRIIMLSIIVENGKMFIRKDEESNFTYFTKQWAVCGQIGLLYSNMESLSVSVKLSVHVRTRGWDWKER
jgi:hypothetical protein